MVDSGNMHLQQVPAPISCTTSPLEIWHHQPAAESDSDPLQTSTSLRLTRLGGEADNNSTRESPYTTAHSEYRAYCSRSPLCQLYYPKPKSKGLSYWAWRVCSGYIRSEGYMIWVLALGLLPPCICVRIETKILLIIVLYIPLKDDVTWQ